MRSIASSVVLALKTQRLYRGMTAPINKKFPVGKNDTSTYYTSWTDNIKLARAYAGDGGYIYYADFPTSERGEEYLNDEGDRVLYFLSNKPAGIHGVSGDEYLVYTMHDEFEKLQTNLLQRSK